MTKQAKSSDLLEWLSAHGVNTSEFTPEVWRLLSGNLRALKDVSGGVSSMGYEEIARNVPPIDTLEPRLGRFREARGLVMSTFNNRTKDIRCLQLVAIACGFDPLLLFIPDLHRHIVNLDLNHHIITLVNSLIEEDLSLEQSIFHNIRCAKCDNFQHDRHARYCSQCGEKI